MSGTERGKRGRGQPRGYVGNSSETQLSCFFSLVLLSMVSGKGDNLIF